MWIRILLCLSICRLASADSSCPTVAFPGVPSAVLAPAANTHRVLIKDAGHYTAYELNNKPPYGLIGEIPQFEKQLSACSLPQSGFSYQDVVAAIRTGDGGYLVAMPQQIAKFDSGMNLITTAPTGIGARVLSDVNGDGFPDLIGMSSQGNGISSVFNTSSLVVALGNGGASFQSSYSLLLGTGLARPYVSAVAVADLNGDGKPDIVYLLSGFAPPEIAILYGNGDGTFQAPQVVFTAVANAQIGAIALGDLNGDGHPDLVFSQNNSESTVGSKTANVLLGKPDGTFASPVAFSVTDTVAVAIGDVNGDGIPDIVTSGVTILFGDGHGGFPSRLDKFAPTFGNLILADFDGDGIVDVVSATGNSAIMAGDVVSVIRGLGKGAFAGPPLSSIVGYPAADKLFTDLATADFNGDGIPDQVVVDNFSHVSVLKGVGDGSFQPTANIQLTPNIVPSEIVVADFNRDGKPDFALVSSGYTADSYGEVDIFLGKGDGTFALPLPVKTALGAFAVAVADFNGDGKPDLGLLLSREGSGSDGVQILLGKGDGTFAAGASYPAGPWTHSIVVGDFNGDGKADLAFSNNGALAAGSIGLLFGNGDGTFNAAPSLPLPSRSRFGPYGLIAADFNRDRKLDLAVTFSSETYGGGGLDVLLGRGDGTFLAPTMYAARAATVQAGDLNGDGLLDLIVSTGSDNPGLVYLLGNGDGTFQPEVRIGPYAQLYVTHPFALADSNLDGKLDLAVVGPSGVFTLLNTPQPTPPFAVLPAAGYVQGPVAPNSIASAFGTNFPANPIVTVTGNSGSAQTASVVFSSPSQINFIMPPNVEAGLATLLIGSQSTSITVAPISPSLFTLNGQGLAAAYTTTINSAGATTNTPVATFANGVYTPNPIDVSSGSTYLILFGTGFRNAPQVTALIGGSNFKVEYAGAQSSFPGLDQVNLLLPPSLKGSGCSSVTISTSPGSQLVSNALYLCIQ